MKKFSLIILVVAVALAISPEAFAQSYDFTFSSPTITITGGVITLTGPAVYEAPGVYSYDIFSISGSYLGPGVSGSISLYPGSGTYYSPNPSVSGWGFDNQFYPDANAPGTSGAVFDVWGLLVNVVGTDYIANLWAGNILGQPGTPNTYTIGQGIPGSSSTNAFETGIGISNAAATLGDPSFSVTPVPESGSLSMLVLSFVGLAGGFFFKARQTGLLLNA